MKQLKTLPASIARGNAWPLWSTTMSQQLQETADICSPTGRRRGIWLYPSHIRKIESDEPSASFARAVSRLPLQRIALSHSSYSHIGLLIEFWGSHIRKTSYGYGCVLYRKQSKSEAMHAAPRLQYDNDGFKSLSLLPSCRRRWGASVVFNV
jgi:hypothetical protein